MDNCNENLISTATSSDAMHSGPLLYTQNKKICKINGNSNEIK